MGKRISKFVEGDRVRVISGEHKGKTGVIVGFLPYSKPKTLTEGVDMVSDEVLYQVKLDGGELKVFPVKELSSI